MSGAGLSLVVLAAGIGSRYGGLKQLDDVGPGGATLMDYAVYDAWRAGFARAVFVIRPDMEAAFQPLAASRFGGRVDVSTTHQRPDVPAGMPIPPTRLKPWGTAHAVLGAEGRVDGPFAVCNADDFYGRAAFVTLAAFLDRDAGGAPPACAVAGYRLRDTVSDAGGVNRAVCLTTPDGWLTGIEEVTDIVRRGDAFTGRRAGGAARLNGAELVSMNLWGFTPALFPVLRDGWAAFLQGADLASAEFLLPAAIATAVGRGDARVRVLEAGSRWWGVTYAEDRARVAEALREMVSAGLYPERLWA